MIKNLAHIQSIFYVRIKGMKMLLHEGISRNAKSFGTGVYRVTAYEHELLLAVTPFPQKGTEPWYIISNDLTDSLADVQEAYYYRFEIEELFRDAKRIFGLEYIRFTHPHNFSTVLWFVIAGIWLHAYLETHLRHAKTVIKKCKSSFNQSITHYWLEQIRFALQAPVLELIFIADG